MEEDDGLMVAKEAAARMKNNRCFPSCSRLPCRSSRRASQRVHSAHKWSSGRGRSQGVGGTRVAAPVAPPLLAVPRSGAHLEAEAGQGGGYALAPGGGAKT